MTPNLSHVVLSACDIHARETAIADNGLRWNYAEFSAQIRAWGARFGAAGAPDRIGFVMPNSAQYLAAMYGAVLAGKTPFLMDDASGETEIAAIGRDVGIDSLLVAKNSRLTFAERDCWEGLRLLALETDGAARSLHGSTAICRFTSGTSGTPKCLEFSHRAVLEAARVWRLSNSFEQKDVILCLAGFFNGLAFNTSLTATFLSGAQLSVYRGWVSPPQVLRHATLESATRLVGFPAFYQLLARSGLERDGIPQSLTHFYSAASRLADDTRDRLHELYDLPIIDYYGVAEAGPVTTEIEPGAARGAGAALSDCFMRIVDGVLEVSTPSMATRYLNRPGELELRMTPDGYFRTSDEARIEDGRLYLGERRDTVLDVGGKKFAAAEVVEALVGLPGVKEAHVFGEPAPDRGMCVCAVVAGRDSGDEPELRRELSGIIARHKIPQEIRFVEALPRNAAGKIDAPRLRSLFSKGAKQDV